MSEIWNEDSTKEEGEISSDCEENDIVVTEAENLDPRGVENVFLTSSSSPSAACQQIIERQDKATHDVSEGNVNNKLWSTLRSSNTPRNQRQGRKDARQSLPALALSPSFLLDPPPPPSPPPLPSEPPPTVPPPPPTQLPTTGEYKPPPKIMFDFKRKYIPAPRLRTPSPDGDVDDTDYIDLLLEYKQIKKQLENLDESPIKSDDEAEKKKKQKKEEEDDDDDLVLLELRRDALISSTVIKTPDTSAKRKSKLKGSSGKKTKPKKSAKKKKDLKNKKDFNIRKDLKKVVKEEPKLTAAVSRKRLPVVEIGPRPGAKRRREGSRERELKVREQRVREEEERLKRERDRVLRQQDQLRRDEHRRDLKHILILDDPEEQARRFKEIVGDTGIGRGSREVTPPVKAKPQEEPAGKDTTAKDNYEEVEMEIESQTSNSPLIFQSQEGESIDNMLYQNTEPNQFYQASMKFWNTAQMPPQCFPPEGFPYPPPPPPPGTDPYQLHPPPHPHPYSSYMPSTNYASIPGLDVDKTYEEIVEMVGQEVDYISQFSSTNMNQNQAIPGLDLVFPSPGAGGMMEGEDMSLTSLSPEPPRMEPFFSDEEDHIYDEEYKKEEEREREERDIHHKEVMMKAAEPVEEDEEDEAEILRAQLLKSMREKQKLRNAATTATAAQKTDDVEKDGASKNVSKEASNKPSPLSLLVNLAAGHETSLVNSPSRVDTGPARNDFDTKDPMLALDIEEQGRRREAEMRESILRKMREAKRSREASPNVAKEEPRLKKLKTDTASTTSSRSGSPSLNNTKLHLQWGLSKVEMPKHKPVVVRLEAESSSEDEQHQGDHRRDAEKRQQEKQSAATTSSASSSTDPAASNSLESTIDSFLKAARASVEMDAELETAKRNKYTSGLVLKHMDPRSQQEYRHLKKKLQVRESIQEAARADARARKEAATESLKDGGNRSVVVGSSGSFTATILNEDAMKEQNNESSVKAHNSESSVVAQSNESSVSPKRIIEFSDINKQEKEEDQEQQQQEEEEAKMKLLRKKEEQRAVKMMEAKMLEARKFLKQYYLEHNQLKLLLQRRKAAFKSAEANVSKLREQLSVAHTIANATSMQVANTTKSFIHMGEKVHQKSAEIKSLMQKIHTMGKQAFGENYQSAVLPHKNTSPTKAVSIVKPQPKKAPQQHPQEIQTAAAAAAAAPPVTPMTPKEQEKQRLQALEIKYRLIIQKHKEKEKKVNNGTDQRKPPHKSLKLNLDQTRLKTTAAGSASLSPFASPAQSPEKLITQDMMVIASGGDDSDTLEAIKQRHRKRRSSNMSSALPMTSPLVRAEKLQKDTAAPADGLNSNEDRGDKATGKNHKKEDFTFSKPTRTQIRYSSKLHEDALKQSHPPALPSSLPVDPAACLFTSSSKPSKATKLENKAAQQVTQEDCNVPFEDDNDLMRFHSFRLSPYYRTKAGLKITSHTFSHKINPQLIMCRYELTGKCNDKKCPWQHLCDTALQEDEVLCDLVSYAPGLAQVTPDTPTDTAKQMIRDYVSEFRKQNSMMRHSELCILLTSTVNQHRKATASSSIVTERRKFRPVEEITKPVAHDEVKDKQKHQKRKFEVPKLSVLPPPTDDILGEQDLRYWMGSSLDTQDMESALTDDPTQINLWIKVAYKKLHDTSSGESEEERLMRALETLSSGLESNRSSSALWEHYLRLYRELPTQNDLAAMCVQSLKHAPSYTLHWMSIQASGSYEEVTAASKAAWEFAASQPASKASLRSHQVLQAVMHHVVTASLSGRLNTAINMLKTVLRQKGRFVRVLTAKDRVLTHLCLIHLAEFHSVPQCLFDPASTNPGRLVNKEPFIMPWKVGCGSRVSIEKLEESLHRALAACTHASLQWPLHLNYIQLYLAHNRIEDAIGYCEKVARGEKATEDAWLKLLDLHKLNDQTNISAQLDQVLQEALTAFPDSLNLANAAAAHYMLSNRTQQAEKLLTEAASKLFEVPPLEGVSDEDEPKLSLLMYRHLLKQSLPLEHRRKLPKQSGKITPLMRLYLWLNYCLLLEMYGEWQEAEEAYETALSKIRQAKHVQLVWLRYLHFSQRMPNASTSLYQRCLNCMPVKVALIDTPDKHWLDYSFHNQVVSMYMESVSEVEKADIYISLQRSMPLNAILTIRCIEYLLEKDDLVRARAVTKMAVQDLPKCLPLVKIAISLTSTDPATRNNPQALRRLYQKSTSNIPYALTLWKNMLLWEVSIGTEAGIRSLLQQSSSLVNMTEFARTILCPRSG